MLLFVDSLRSGANVVCCCVLTVCMGTLVSGGQCESRASADR